MGLKSNPVIGYWYGLGLHFGLCNGPVDQIREIRAGGKTAWSGTQTASGGIAIHKPNLFGGKHKEGGIDGTATVMMGDQSQAANAYLTAQLGTPMPAFRGLVTIVFRGLVTAMSPYVKPWSFKVSRWTAGWRTPVWQSSLAKVGEGMNPAHIIYRCITDPITGLGHDPSVLDDTRMLAAAQTLSDEGLGLCLKWSHSDVLGNFIQTICDHVGGAFVDDPVTGLQYLKLFRADYDIDTATLLDESNIIDLISYEQASLAGSVNQVTVTYHSVDDNKDHDINVQNLANVQAQGAVIDEKKSYPGLWSADLATRTAMRDLKAKSALPAKIKLKIMGTTVVRQGDVLAFSWSRLNITRMPIRVIEIERGTPTDGAITLTCAQDVYALPSATYLIAQDSKWTAPVTTPAPVPDQVVIESTYRDLSARLKPADLAQVTVLSGYIGALGDKPPCVAYGYALMTRIGSSGDFVETTTGPNAPTGKLSAPMAAEAGPTSVTIDAGEILDQVTLPCEVLIDDEIMRCDALDADTGVATLARGCVDTVPAAHAQNARVWFTDGWTAADPTEYAATEQIQAKLLTRTSAGELDSSLATTASVTLDQRQDRPYPPAGLKINGSAYPAYVIETLSLAWVARNRITQADQLIDTTEATVTAETGTTYIVRTYLNDVLDHTETGLTALTYAPSPSGYGPMRVEIDAVRDGLTSWQSLTASFDYRSALAITTTSPIMIETGSAQTFQMDASGGVTPYTWSVDQLPAGCTMDASGLISSDGSAAIGDTASVFALNDSGGSQQQTLTATVRMYDVTSVPLSNGDFSAGLTGWTIAAGSISAQSNFRDWGYDTFAGRGSYIELRQTVALPSSAFTAIDAGDVAALAGWMGTTYVGDSDSGRCGLLFYDADDQQLGSTVWSGLVNYPASGWTADSMQVPVPVGARSVMYRQYGQRNSGTNCDYHATACTLDLLVW